MMAVNIANELDKEATIESYLCATRLEGGLKEKLKPTVHYLFLNKKKRIDIKAIKKLHTYMTVHQITIIHAHSSSYFMGFLMKLLNPKLSLIWQDHYGKSESLERRSKFPLNIISNAFSLIISVNTKLMNWALKYLNTKAVSYIPNFAVFNKNTSKETFLKGEVTKRIICLANLRTQKDHLNLLKAFKVVHVKYKDWTLHLIGMDFNDTYASEIKTFIRLNELSNHVFLYGSCNDTKFILSQATIGVLSSKSEGLPVTLLEYGLAKLPVIVTDVGECAKVVQNERSGLVVAPNNNQDLAKGIIRLIDDKKTSIAFGKKLNNEIQLNYSKENYIKKLLSIYKSE
ncbi:MAG: glycosyl transferase [Flavobacteriaceae bacterium]|nr:MAG: glycosyl transferase [Flavobacteriaceae bacterium]